MAASTACVPANKRMRVLSKLPAGEDIFFSESLNEPILVFIVHVFLLALPQSLYFHVRLAHVVADTHAKAEVLESPTCALR